MRALLVGLLAAALAAYDDYQPYDTRAMLGISMAPPSAAVQAANGTEPDVGVEATAVYPGSAAERMGLRPGDLIVGINGSPVGSMTDLRNEVALAGVGSPATVEVLRNGRRLLLSDTLDAWPPHIPFEPIDDAAERRFREWQARRLERTEQAMQDLQRQVEALEQAARQEPPPAGPMAPVEAQRLPATRALAALPPLRLCWRFQLATPAPAPPPDGSAPLRWQARLLLGSPPPTVF